MGSSAEKMNEAGSTCSTLLAAEAVVEAVDEDEEGAEDAAESTDVSGVEAADAVSGEVIVAVDGASVADEALEGMVECGVVEGAAEGSDGTGEEVSSMSG